MNKFFVFILTVVLHSQVFSEPMTGPMDRYLGWSHFKEYSGFHPYICEFGYRSIADHVIDPESPTFDPLDVKPGDSIYCAVWFLDWFVEEVHDKIPNPYILITCDVGSWIPNPAHLKLVYDPKVVYWFGKNMLFTNHPKLFQLPMGQIYHLWCSIAKQYMGTLNALAFKPQEKDIFLYLNYTERDHGRRILIADKFADKPYCYNRNRPRSPTVFAPFWEELARSKFVLSPLGLEIDCTRTWESFVLGAIPIVEHSFLDPLYDNLPILLIHDWDEVHEEFLQKKYEEISTKEYNLKPVLLDYWKDLIHEKQDIIRKGDVKSSFLEETLFDSSDLKAIRRILYRFKKTRSLLIYQGSMTCLRPFQLAKKRQSIKEIQVLDLWSQEGYPFIEKFAQDDSLLAPKNLKIYNVNEKDSLLKQEEDKSVFLDLTHFRHKLFTETAPLDDFCHSLERDILTTYQTLLENDLLLGNMIKDPYVQEVIERLKEKHNLPIEVYGDFWHCSK